MLTDITMKPTIYAAMKPFAERAGQIRMFDFLLHEVVPKAMAGRIHVLNVRDGILVLGVDHAAMATQIRFQSPQWLIQLNTVAQKERGLPILTSVETRIATDAPQKKAPKVHRELGASTRELLMEMATHETDDHLAQTLRRLAHTGQIGKGTGRESHAGDSEEASG